LKKQLIILIYVDPNLTATLFLSISECRPDFIPIFVIGELKFVGMFVTQLWRGPDYRARAA
jgi:hypothetical protein